MSTVLGLIGGVADYQAGAAYCFSDSAGTVPCNDGDLVYVWKDSSGNGNDATQSVSGSRPTYRADQGDGTPVVDFAGNKFMNMPAGVSVNPYVGATVMMVARMARPTTTGSGTDTVKGGEHCTPIEIGSGSQCSLTANWGMQMQYGGTGAPGYNLWASNMRLGIHGYSVTSAGTTLYAGNSRSRDSHAPANATITGGTIGKSNGTSYFGGVLSRVSIFGREINSVEMSFLQRQLRAIIGLPKALTGDPHLLLLGDSLTYGWGTAGGGYGVPWTASLGYSIAQARKDLNAMICGGPGHTAAKFDTALNSGQTLRDQHIQYQIQYARRGPTAAIVWAGTNDGNNGVAAATVLASLTSIVAKNAALGISSIVCTPIDRIATDGTVNHATFAAFSASLASSIMDGSNPTGAAGVVNLGATFTDCTNTTWFDADKTHLTVAGAAKAGSLILPVLAAVIPPQVSDNEYDTDPGVGNVKKPTPYVYGGAARVGALAAGGGVVFDVIT